MVQKLRHGWRVKILRAGTTGEVYDEGKVKKVRTANLIPDPDADGGDKTPIYSPDAKASYGAGKAKQGEKCNLTSDPPKECADGLLCNTPPEGDTGYHEGTCTPYPKANPTYAPTYAPRARYGGSLEGERCNLSSYPPVLCAKGYSLQCVHPTVDRYAGSKAGLQLVSAPVVGASGVCKVVKAAPTYAPTHAPTYKPGPMYKSVSTHITQWGLTAKLTPQDADLGVKGFGSEVVPASLHEEHLTPVVGQELAPSGLTQT